MVHAQALRSPSVLLDASHVALPRPALAYTCSKMNVHVLTHGSRAPQPMSCVIYPDGQHNQNWIFCDAFCALAIVWFDVV